MAVSGRLKIYEDSAWQYTGYGMSGTSGHSGYSGYNKFPWKGHWVSPGPYILWDCVEYNGCGYVCVQAATTQVPGIDTDFWSLFVQRGYSGYSGISGYSGKSGYSGYSGYSGFSGYSGISGYSGLNAETIGSGYSGYSGFSGYSAISYMWKGSWSGSSVSYYANDVIGHNGNGYICILTHVSGIDSLLSDEPGVGSNWTTYWSLFVERGISGYSGYSAAVGPGDTGGTGSAGNGKQWVSLTIAGTTYKLLHDGTI